jgi:hypothetical protein
MWSDFEGGAAGVLAVPGSTLTFGPGTIALDPSFTDPDGADGDPATIADNDYRLTLASPCIDSGDNSSIPSDVLDLDLDGDVTEPVPFDLDGNARFRDVPGIPDTGSGTPPIVDMGAYEEQR